jgi:hypothetical protein
MTEPSGKDGTMRIGLTSIYVDDQDQAEQFHVSPTRGSRADLHVWAIMRFRVGCQPDTRVSDLN